MICRQPPAKRFGLNHHAARGKTDMAVARQPLTQLPVRGVRVAPSILAADFAELAAEIRRAEAAGADVIHIDIMDGHFVPNLSMGPAIVAALRPHCGLPFDVHLMLSNPTAFIEPFAKAGADHLTIHIESESTPAATHACLQKIRDLGLSCGLSLKPATAATTILPFLPQIDLVLVMSVEPGFGGQSFNADMLPKIACFRQAIDAGCRQVHLEVDGGIDKTTAPLVIAAGADLLVAGTSVFRADAGIAAAIAALRA